MATEPYVTTWRECVSMRLLARDGWTSGELKMCFHVSRYSVRKHVTGGCKHEHETPAIPDWTSGEHATTKLPSDQRAPLEAD